jgi:hypothetical protein
VFDGLSAALANFAKVKLAELPRMADFSIWVVAAEPALPWELGTFLNVYSENRASVVEHSLEGDVVAVAVRAFMADRETWEGAPSALLEALETITPESTIRSKAWPKAANWLTNRLRRAATFLRAIGIEFDQEKSGKRLISLRKGMQNTAHSALTVHSQEPCGFAPDDILDDIDADDNTVQADVDDNTVQMDGTQKIPSTWKSTTAAGLDGMDDKDDKIHTFSKARPTSRSLAFTWDAKRQRQAAAKVRHGLVLSDDLFSGEEVEL